MASVDYVLFEAGSSAAPDERSDEAVFWARNLLPSTVKLEVCFGNKAIVKKIESLAAICTAVDKIFVVFDNANLYKYTKDGGLTVRQSGLFEWKKIADALSRCRARCFRCLSLSFEALILETGVQNDILTMLEEYYTQRGDENQVIKLRKFKDYMQNIPSLRLGFGTETEHYLRKLFAFVPDDLLREGSCKEPGPEPALFQLVCHSLAYKEFKIQKGKIGRCWRDACRNIRNDMHGCIADQTDFCPKLCQGWKLYSDTNDDTLFWKASVIKDGLGISDFTDLFEEILK